MNKYLLLFWGLWLWFTCLSKARVSKHAGVSILVLGRWPHSVRWLGQGTQRPMIIRNPILGLFFFLRKLCLKFVGSLFGLKCFGTFHKQLLYHEKLPSVIKYSRYICFSLANFMPGTSTCQAVVTLTASGTERGGEGNPPFQLLAAVGTQRSSAGQWLTLVT